VRVSAFVSWSPRPPELLVVCDRTCFPALNCHGNLPNSLFSYRCAAEKTVARASRCGSHLSVAFARVVCCGGMLESASVTQAPRFLRKRRVAFLLAVIRFRAVELCNRHDEGCSQSAHSHLCCRRSRPCFRAAMSHQLRAQNEMHLCALRFCVLSASEHVVRALVGSSRRRHLHRSTVAVLLLHAVCLCSALWQHSYCVFLPFIRVLGRLMHSTCLLLCVCCCDFALLRLSSSSLAPLVTGVLSSKMRSACVRLRRIFLVRR
jgi:hypothetical protein